MPKVKLVNHVPCMELRSPEIWQKWAGTYIQIGAPIQPNDLLFISVSVTGPWSCDTDLIWPITDREMSKDYKEQVYICRHMFEGAD